MEMNFGGVNLHNANICLTAGLPKQLVKEGLPQIAFSGRSNVGKSSLVNSLLGRKKLARVSSEPGKTITVNCYDVDKKLWLVEARNHFRPLKVQQGLEGLPLTFTFSRNRTS